MNRFHHIIPILILLLAAFSGQAFAQRKVSIIGKVKADSSHKPLAGVSVFNISEGTGTLTDSMGNYKISAEGYDRIIFSYIGYANDTIQVNALYTKQIINISLHKNKYSIAVVNIFGQRPNYALDSAKRRAWFAQELDQNKVNGLGAVMHPISALYDALSGRAKRLWRFQKDYKAYEQRKYIQSRVHPAQITKLFHLKGDSLKAFLLWYSPNYNYVRNATDYALLENIKHAVARFRKVWVKKPNMDLKNQNVR